MEKPKLLSVMADRYHVDADIFKNTVYKMCMPKDATDEEFCLFMLVANEHDLNPMTREIFAIRKSEKSGGGIQPVVSVDGWVKIIQRKPQLDGFEFIMEWTDAAKSLPFSCTCKMYRKDQEKPTLITEYFNECKRIRDNSPWNDMPCRMIRHKALIQCARYAFGFAGIMDEDEAETIKRVEGREIEPEDRTAELKNRLKNSAPALPESTGEKVPATTTQPKADAVRSGGAKKQQQAPKAPSESTPAVTEKATTTAAPEQKSGGTATPEAATNHQQAAKKSPESVQTPAAQNDTGEIFEDVIRVGTTLEMGLNKTKFIDLHENAFYSESILVTTQIKELTAAKKKIAIEWRTINGKAIILNCKEAPEPKKE